MNLEISTDPARLDVALIHQFLTESYWAKGIPLETVEQSIRGSLCFGAYDGKAQLGYARVISDRATIAYLGDVFVLPEARGRGVSKALMEAIVAHPDLQGLRRWILLTRDAHKLFEQFAFKPIANPPLWMERHDPDAYLKNR
jgi:GNAT superfamily N-acetyltransferase